MIRLSVGSRNKCKFHLERITNHPKWDMNQIALTRNDKSRGECFRVELQKPLKHFYYIILSSREYSLHKKKYPTKNVG